MPHTLKPDNHEEKGTTKNLWITENYPQAAGTRAPKNMT